MFEYMISSLYLNVCKLYLQKNLIISSFLFSYIEYKKISIILFS